MSGGRLVLTRKLDEEVVIHMGGQELARFKVHEISKGQVRIAFQAENSVQIDRLERYKNENK